ncbi:MAG: response regulator [Syntrophomonas sp.]
MRVLLVDKRVLFLEGLKKVFHSNNIEVAGTALSNSDALEKTRELDPDLIVIDVTGAGQERLNTIRQIKAENGAIKIIVLADSKENLAAAEQNKACGCLLNSIVGEDLLAMINELGKELKERECI